MLPLIPDAFHFEISLEKVTASTSILDMFFRVDMSDFEMSLLHIVALLNIPAMMLVALDTPHSDMSPSNDCAVILELVCERRAKMRVYAVTVSQVDVAGGPLNDAARKNM